MTQTQSKTQIWPQLLMVTATVIWGSSFLFMKQSVESIPVFFHLSIRFTIAVAVFGLLFWKKWKLLTRPVLFKGFVVGTLMTAAYIFQTYGLKTIGPFQGTTPGKNAFFTAIYCILVPFLAWLISRKRPDGYNIAAALLCVGGIGLVSVSGASAIVGGDLLTMLGGLMFALHILAVSHYSHKGCDVILLTLLQFIFMALWSWLGVLLTGEVLTTLPSGADCARILYLAIAASALAMLFQNIGEAHTPPAAAAVLLSLEVPFGVLFSVLFGNERPTAAMYCGIALIFFAIIVSETKLSFLPLGKKFQKRG